MQKSLCRILLTIVVGMVWAGVASAEVYYSQNFNSGYTPTEDPWDAEQVYYGTTATQPAYEGSSLWVSYSGQYTDRRRRAYESLSQTLTDYDTFDVSFVIYNTVRGSDGSNIGSFGLYKADYGGSDTNIDRPFIGINLGGYLTGGVRNPTYMLNVKPTGSAYTDWYMAPAASCAVAFETWHEIVISYDAETRTFSQTTLLASTGEQVASASYVLPSNMHFDVDSFGFADCAANAGRSITIRADDVLVQSIPEPMTLSICGLSLICVLYKRRRK